MKRILLSILIVALLGSCAFIDSVLNGDVVARVGNNVLYHRDIDGLVPKGTSPEDSASIVRQYIHTWATNKLLLSNAEERLSREDKDIEQAVEDYKTSLLVYRYEKLYVEKNLDTLITDQESRDYYELHKEAYTLPYSVIKARYIKISTASPQCQQLKSVYKSLKPEDLDRVDELARTSADTYSDFNMNWVPLPHVVKDMGMELSDCEKVLDSKNYMEVEKGNFLYLLRVYDRVKGGEVTPYDYNIHIIKESILSKRKQELIANLERNLLEDALNNNKLVIYSNNND
jgi:hypothetical protein